MNAIIQPYLDEFELYLEGVKMPTFESIQISEVDEEIPAAQVTFIFNSEILKILPGSLVQIFCKRTYYKPNGGKEEKTLLIFEGEIGYMSFNYSSFGHLVTFKANSVLSKMYKARMRPSHAVLQQEQWDAELLVSQKFSISSDNTEENKKVISPETDSNSYEPVAKNDATKTDNTVVSNESSKKKTISGDFKNLKNEGSVQNFIQAISEELAPANNRPGSRGDYNYILQRFNREFENNDLVYGLSSVGFKISPSLLAFPNPGKAKAYHLAIFQKALNTYLQDLTSNPLAHKEQYALMDIFRILKDNIHYKLLMPAMPFSGVHFNTGNIGPQINPIRMLFIPSFESGPPIKCNVFFPEQTDNFSFQRDFMNEPSRLIASMSYASVPGMEGLPEYLNPIHVVPDVDIKQESDKTGKLTIASKLLFEETYKGVTLKASQYDASLIKTLYDQKTGKQKSDVVDKKSIEPILTNNTTQVDNTVINKKDSDREKEINQMLRVHAMQEFAGLKFGQRMATFTAEWSPYRIVGLPGAILLDTNLSAVGVIHSISTVISAKGQLQSNVTFKNVRLVFEGIDNIDTTNIDYSLDVDKLVDKDKNFLANSYIPDNYREGLMGPNPVAFNDDIYSFANIGKTLYPYLIKGEVTDYFKGKASESLKEFTKATISDRSDSILDTAAIRELNLEYLKNDKGYEYHNYTFLKKGITFVKKANSEFKEDIKKFEYQEEYNSRGTISKEAYLKYLNIDNIDLVEQSPLQYSKHLFNFLQKVENDAQFLQEKNSSMGSNLISDFNGVTINYVDVIKSTVIASSSPTYIYRIYNTNRLAHILNLKNYLKTINNLT